MMFFCYILSPKTCRTWRYKTKYRAFGEHYSVVFIDTVQTYRNKITKGMKRRPPQNNMVCDLNRVIILWSSCVEEKWYFIGTEVSVWNVCLIRQSSSWIECLRRLFGTVWGKKKKKKTLKKKPVMTCLTLSKWPNPAATITFVYRC